MLKLGVPVDYRDEDTGNTPLMVACQAGQRQAMFYLVEQGADVNAQNIYGASPLHELIKVLEGGKKRKVVSHSFCFFLFRTSVKTWQFGSLSTEQISTLKTSALTLRSTWRFLGSRRI